MLSHDRRKQGPELRPYRPTALERRPVYPCNHLSCLLITLNRCCRDFGRDILHEINVLLVVSNKLYYLLHHLDDLVSAQSADWLGFL